MCVLRFASSFQSSVSNWLNHSPLNVQDDPDLGGDRGVVMVVMLVGRGIEMK